MNRHKWAASLLSVIALTAAWPAAAHDRNALIARDVVHCMKARMRSEQSETYRDAFKACKQQLDPLSRDGEAAKRIETADLSAHPKR